MSVSARFAALGAGLLFAVVGPQARPAVAADSSATAKQLEARNNAAVAAYEAGDFDKMKAVLQKAIALGEKGGLGSDPAMARTYLLAGVLHVDGLEQRDAGVRYFVKALKAQPDLQLPTDMATKAVAAAFKQARGEAAEGAPAEAGEAAPAAKGKAAAAAEPEESSASGSEAAEAPAEGKPDRAASAREEKQRAASAAAEKKRADAEERERQRQAAAEDKDRERESAKIAKDLAQVKESQGKERAEKQRLQAEKEKLQSEKQERDQQVTELKAIMAQAEKETEKARLDAQKQLADGAAREKKEREAKEKLEKEKAERDKQLADLKAHKDQLEKEKAERDKQLAETAAREKKEREAKEKLEKERQVAEARDKERRAYEDRERVEREKQAAGPDLPARLSEALQCAVADEALGGTDLFVHCAARPEVKAKTIAFYYRVSGAAHYNSLLMERSKKGWYTTMVPGNKLTGRLLQYYAEARDGREAVAATNGKASSPNVVTLRPSGAPIASDVDSPSSARGPGAGRAAAKSRTR